MLYYYLFWMIMGFIVHFYITFGTNLLTGGPAHIAVLLHVLVFRRKGISNGVQTEWNLRHHDFLEEYHPGGLEIKSEDTQGAQEIGPHLQGASPLSRGPLEHPPTDFFRLYKPTYHKTSTIKIEREFRRREELSFGWPRKWPISDEKWDVHF